jgi:hypothetical protein
LSRQLPHKALLTEIVSATQTSSRDDVGDRPARRHRGGGGGGGHCRGGPVGPEGFIGGMMGGLFR